MRLGVECLFTEQKRSAAPLSVLFLAFRSRYKYLLQAHGQVPPPAVSFVCLPHPPTKQTQQMLPKVFR